MVSPYVYTHVTCALTDAHVCPILLLICSRKVDCFLCCLSGLRKEMVVEGSIIMPERDTFCNAYLK